MPIFVTVNGPLGSVSFAADGLGNDPGVPGNLMATNISECPVTLPSGRVFVPKAWSFRGTDLLSYMIGDYADAPSGIFSMAAGMAEAAAATAPSAEEAAAISENLDDAVLTAAPAAKKRSRR